MAKFRPLHAGHAIEEAVVGIRLSSPASSDGLKLSLAEAKSIADAYGLPGRVNLQTMGFLINPAPVSSGFSVGGQGVGATIFQRMAPDGSIDSELTVDLNLVAYRTRQYRRWAEFADVIENVLAPIAARLAQESGASVTVIELRYTDRFVAPMDEDQAPDISTLFRADSPLLPELVHRLEGMWHSHSGWYQDQTEEKRTLVNVNVDVVDVINSEDEPQRGVTVMKVVSFHYNDNLGGGVAIGEGFPSQLVHIFQRAHSQEKALLADLITDDMQNSIDLWASSNGQRA